MRRFPFSLAVLAIAPCASAFAQGTPVRPVSVDSAPAVIAPGTPRSAWTTPAAVRVNADHVRPRHRTNGLSPLADSIARNLVFIPRGRQQLLVVSRAKRVLVDLGRVDVDVRKDERRLAAYREAVAARSPYAKGAQFTLRGNWGAGDATIESFDVWNGRITAVLKVDSLADSLTRAGAAIYAVARVGADTVMAAPADSSASPAPACERDSLPTGLAARVKFVSDSLEQQLREKAMPRYARLVPTVSVKSTKVNGCFGASRVLLVSSLRTKTLEWVQERVVLVDPAGKVTPMAVNDLRLKAHDVIAAFDADGDGVDDVAMRGTRERAGGTSILRVDLKSKRLDRIVSGFAWEER